LSHEQTREIQQHHERISALHRARPILKSAAITTNSKRYGDIVNPSRRDGVTGSSSNSSSYNYDRGNLVGGGGAFHLNMPQVEAQSIKQAVTDTVSLIATAARHAKKSAQRNLVQHVQYHNKGHDECNSSSSYNNSSTSAWGHHDDDEEESYTGPYAKIPNDLSRGGS
jgi:hypothetical protein